MSSHHYRQDQSMIAAKRTGKEPIVTTWPTPSDSLNVLPTKSSRRPSLSQSIFAQPQPSNNPSPTEGDLHNGKHSSNTWTSSSEHSDPPAEEDGKDDWKLFVQEYNRLAQRHGLRSLVPSDFSSTTDYAKGTVDRRRDSWFSKMLRQAAEQSAQIDSKPDRPSLRHQRSVSDVASGLVQSHRRGGLRDRDLTTLVRLCGKSRLFLPTDYAPFSLTLPTCFRALAQALIQHADTKGIFRVPGSARVVNELYEYYCTNEDIDAITSTTRCPTLPTHIRCNTHDIASTFKRLLAGLPGGILGSLLLFDALVAIYSQLQGDAEVHRTKESKLRARLIALAIGTVKSRYQRELICAVFGLLCLVGRIAENAPREDETGHPLPTTDLMGYNALGIIFGPLLIGNMIDDYSMKVADPSGGLILLPVSSPRSRKERHKHKHQHRHRHKSRHRHGHSNKHTPITASSSSVDKVRIANSITEMLIVHWREVVRQIRNTGSVKNRQGAPSLLQRQGSVRGSMSSSISEDLSLKNRPLLDNAGSRSASPATVSPATSGVDPSSITRSGSITKHSVKNFRHSSSPMIEENPSTSTSKLKPTLGEETARNGDGGYAHDNHPISSRTHPSQVRKDNPAKSASKLENTGKDAVGGVDTIAVRPTSIQQSETTPINPPLVQQDKTPSTPSLNSPMAGISTQYEHEPVPPSMKPPQQVLRHGSVGELNDLENKGPQRTQTTAETGFSEQTSPVEPHRDSYGDEAFRNSGILMETPNPGYSHTRILSTHDLSSEALGSPTGQWRNLMASSGESTESLAKSAKARRLKRSSIPVLSRPKDATVLAVTASTLPRSKQKLIQKGYAPIDKCTTLKPNSERHRVCEGASQPTRPTRLTLGTNVNHSSPSRHSSNVPRIWDSQRSTSKPMPGAVKAMAALFDSAAKESPDGSVAILTGRTRNSPNEFDRFTGHDSLDSSPIKSKPRRGAPASTASARLNQALSQEKRSSVARSGASTLRPAPAQPGAEPTPTKTTRSTLRPVKMFSSARNEPQISRNATIPNQPPRLGTMVPYAEEPPIGHFVRPSSATSAQSQSQNQSQGLNPEGLLAPPPLDRSDSRQSGASSLLHAQVRNLQRQLALRNEEIAQLRRRLETQEHMDIGTLCEQLRFAKRECLTWRKRAEAAERRIAVFQRFGAKVLLQSPDGVVEEEGEGDDDDDERNSGNRDEDGSGDGDGDYDQGESSRMRRRRLDADFGYGPDELGRDDGGSSPSYSIRTENRDAFNDRIRRSFARNARVIGGGDGAVFEETCDACTVHGYQRSPRQVRLWKSECEIPYLQHGDSIHVFGRERSAL